MADEQRHLEARTIEQVGVVSLAKIIGLMGVLWILILIVPALVIGSSFGVGASVGDVVILVVGAGLYGTFGGAVSAVIYNLAAELAGGIEIRLDPQGGDS